MDGNMTFQNIGIILTAIISSLSLLLSIFNYWTSKPKLKIEITDKEWDCFFGIANYSQRNKLKNYIGGGQINIINNSPVAITINRINLVVNGEVLPLIDNKLAHWKDVEFYFVDDEGKWTTDGTGIAYDESGLTVPFKINAYDTITAYVLFFNFPIKCKNNCKGTFVLNTAIGKVKKNVKLVKYDKKYLEKGYREYLQYCRSLDE